MMQSGISATYRKTGVFTRQSNQVDFRAAKSAHLGLTLV